MKGQTMNKWIIGGVAGVLGLLWLRGRNQALRMQSDAAALQALADKAKAEALAAKDEAARKVQEAYDKADAYHNLIDKIEDYVYE
jgi:hypothetical protein